MWSTEIEELIRSTLEECDAAFREEFKGFFLRSNPLYLPKTHFRETLAFLLDRAPTSSRILDFGCGTGQLLLFLWHFGFRNLLGWDANPRLLVGAQELFVRLADPNSVQFRAVEREWINDIRSADPQPFDAITMFGVIYIIKDHDTVIASVCDALKPGGFFIFNDSVNERQAVVRAIERNGFDLIREVTIRSRSPEAVRWLPPDPPAAGSWGRTSTFFCQKRTVAAP